MLEMNDREKFLFDMRGYLLVPDFLSQEDVAKMNEAVDVHEDQTTEDTKMYGGGMLGTKGRRSMGGLVTWEQPYCQPFRDLIAHPKLIPYLNTILGRGWRLESPPGVATSPKGAGGHGLHGTTNRQFRGAECYIHTNGQIRAGLTILQVQLHDIHEGDGGIAVIPGSHKANFKCPEEIMLYEEDKEVVYNVASKTGDLIIFMEATLHGALPWTAEYDRRSVLWSYAPKYMTYHNHLYEAKLPDWVDELTEAQRAAMEPAYMYSRPLIADDGVSIDQPNTEPVPYIPRSVEERGH